MSNITLETYTTTIPVDISPINLSFPFDTSFENTSSASIWSFWRIKYPYLTYPIYPETYPAYPEEFIGILTDEEARKMREELNSFKKRFNDDFRKKRKELWDEE